MDDAKLNSIKFLEKVKAAAMLQMDLAVPYDRPDLFTTKRFVIGFIYALTNEGYEIILKPIKKEENT